MDLLLRMTARQDHIRYRELAVLVGFMTESDARVPVYAYQACAAFATRVLLLLSRSAWRWVFLIKVRNRIRVEKILFLTVFLHLVDGG